MSKSSHRIAASVAALLLSAALRAEPAVIGLARAYLGPESTLDGIKTIHYVGTLDRVDPDHAAAPVHMTLDMLFEKPMRQRLTAKSEKVTMTTVLDDYEAWDWLQDNADASRHQLKWLTAGDVRALRASTWENLYYFRPPEGGSIDDKGPATIDGVECEEVDFSHGGGPVYQRYFDRDTGRLVLTVRGPDSFRESGEIRVDGVRFPKKIITLTKLASGKELVSTATFESVGLNEPLPEVDFAVPNPPAAPAKAAALAAPAASAPPAGK